MLEDADLTLFDQQKIGIVGANGAGKSSLFQCLLGQLQPDSGEIDIPSKLNIAHLKQETPGVEDSALDYALQGDHEYTLVKTQMTAVEASGDGMAIAEIHARFAEIDGYTAPSRAAIILNGLGFSEEQLHWPVRDFSGGWRMRLNLAQVLLSRSDIMLLDEPTNHLDLEGIIWLAEWIQAAKCLVLIISHDREFLDDISTHIVHFKNEKLKRYTGNYSQFEKEYALQLSVQQATYDKQQAHKAHLQKFIDRFGAKATKAKQANSRKKMIERMDLVEAVHQESPFRFEFADNTCGVNPMLTIDHAEVGYDERIILNNLTFSFSDGDRIGLLGFNGAGKSTLIKLLAGELTIRSGEMHSSNKMKVGYFAQHQLELLDAQENLLWHLRKLDQSISESRARTFLGGFNFQGERVFDQVKSLSGGEKARLVLALLVWQQPNLLLMDEPTNHLDMEMREALMLALQNFQGAMVLVSHDRYLLNCLVDQFWLVDEGKVSPFAGDLEDYRTWFKAREDALQAQNKAPKATAPNPSLVKPSVNHKQLEKDLRKLENSLTKLTEQRHRLEHQLADNDLYEADNHNTLKTVQAEYEAVQQEIADVEEKLLELYEQQV